MRSPLKRSHVSRVAVWLVSAACLLMLTSSVVARPAAPRQADTGHMWALVVGVSNYVHAEPLQYAADDANAFSQFLKSPRGGDFPDDQVVILTEDQATRVGVLMAVHELQGKVQPGDVVYVYFAGHGYIQNNVGYFIPIDATLDTAFMTAVPFDQLKAMIEQGLVGTEVRFLVTDMCFGGRIGPEQSAVATAIQNLINEELSNISGGGGTFLNLLASQPNEASWESDELEQGVFTYALLEALNGAGVEEGTTVTTASNVVPFVQDEVAAYTANQQHPVANQDYEPELVLSYLDRPGPEVAAPEVITNLILTNTAESGYQRVEWQEPETESKAVLSLEDAPEAVEISPLRPGPIDLVFYDADAVVRTVSVELQEGENMLRVDTAGMDFTPAGPYQVAALGATTLPAPRQVPLVAADTSVLMVRLEPETDVFLDGQYFGNAGADSQLMELRGLVPGVHNVQLVLSPEREQRFRVELFPGAQTLNPTSGELLFMAARPPAPTAADVPPTVPPAQVQTYQNFDRALWAGQVIEPDGASAWDYYNQLVNVVPADVAEDLRDRLAVAMGNKAQQTLLKYRRGGDIRWSTEVFEEGSLLTERVLTLRPEVDALQTQQLFFDGRAQAEDGQYALAVQTLQQAIDLDASASHAYNAIGLSFWQQGLFDTAIPQLQQAIALAPEWNYPRYTLSLVYLEQRLYDLAEQGFQAALLNDAEDSTAYHGLGQLAYLRGQNDDADAQLQQAVLFNPGNAYAYNTYSQLRQRQGLLDEAEDMLRLAIRLEPDELAFQARLGEFLAANDRADEAETVLADLAANNPGNLSIVRSYASFLTAQDRADEADQVFQNALDASPEDSNLYQVYGGFLLDQGELDDAEDALDEAIDLNDQNAFAYTDRARLHLERQDLDDAIDDLEAAIEIDPRYPAPLERLAQIRSAQGRYEEALELFEDAREFSVEPAQQQDFSEQIDATRTLLVDARLGEANEEIADRDFDDAWNIYVETAAVAPEDPNLRNAILEFRFTNPDDADIGDLPEGLVRDVFDTEFWQAQTAAEELWQDGEAAGAIDAFVEAFEGLDAEALRLIAGTRFNLGNETQGIHQVVYRWAMRMVGQGDYTAARELMDASQELNIYAPVPDFAPLTIDSLMVPADAVNPQVFTDFEISHHPDVRAHEVYAVVASVTDGVDAAAVYFEALEGAAGPDATVRLSVARTLDREAMPGEVITVLREVVLNQEQVRQRDVLPSVYALLGETECAVGDCAQGEATLEAGLGLFPNNNLISDALDRIR